MNTIVARPWLVLLGLSLGVTVTNGFARFAYGLLLPSMQIEKSWNYAQAGWLNTANAFGYIAGAIITMFLIRKMLPSYLFALGLLSTTLGLLATGLNSELWWQTLWRILVGVFGAMSFSTAGVLTAGLFGNDARKNALAIALLFGSGGGLGIVLAGAILPLMLETYGSSFWPLGWTIIGVLSLFSLPLGIWAAFKARVSQQAKYKISIIPFRRISFELIGYAGFGLGYIVYLTFLSAWMTENLSSAVFISLVWVTLGLCICLSPFIWQPILTRYASGLPLALILICIAIGTALPVVFTGELALVASALIFGSSVFMAPGAVANFTRQNLPPVSWGRVLSLFTVVFSVAQTVGPYGAGLIGDYFGNIGVSLLVSSAILMLGAFISLFQKPL
tara:strand:+ start:807 stop:1976 length:1170 start_codon:yes stop_codon:yes gene_type:complete